jgi:hypothetical protein
MLTEILKDVCEKCFGESNVASSNSYVSRNGDSQIADSQGDQQPTATIHLGHLRGSSSHSPPPNAVRDDSHSRATAISGSTEDGGRYRVDP